MCIFRSASFPLIAPLVFFFPQALHKISLRETVCTRRVCDAILSILFTLIDFGVLADRNKRRRQEDEDKKAYTIVVNIFYDFLQSCVYFQDDKERKEGDGEEKDGGEEEKDKKEDEAAAAAAAETGSSSGAAGAAQGGDKKDVLSVHSTFMDVVVRSGQIGERLLQFSIPKRKRGPSWGGEGGAVFGPGLVTFFILEAAEKTPPSPPRGARSFVRSQALSSS